MTKRKLHGAALIAHEKKLAKEGKLDIDEKVLRRHGLKRVVKKLPGGTTILSHERIKHHHKKKLHGAALEAHQKKMTKIRKLKNKISLLDLKHETGKQFKKRMF